MKNSKRLVILFAATLILCGCQKAKTNAENSLDYVNSGLTKEQKQDYAGAVQDYTMAIQADQKNADAYFRRASAESLIIDPDYLANKNRALEDYGKAIEISPQEPSYYLWRALLEQDSAKNKEALADFNQAEKLGLTSSKALLINRAYAKGGLGDFKGSQEDYEAAQEAL